MKTRDRLLETLRESEGGLCDDCLSERSGVVPRQRVYMLANELSKAGRTSRSKVTCSSCGRLKFVTLAGALTAPAPVAARVTPEIGRSWTWEGNVQSAIATHLASKGYHIISSADTASREAGKDLEARGPDGKLIWVSVKGWPEKSTNTQARHWFSQALFDMILYREEDPEVQLAIGLPSGFSTYRNLWQRIGWFRSVLSLRAYWVQEDG